MNILSNRLFKKNHTRKEIIKPDKNDKPQNQRNDQMMQALRSVFSDVDISFLIPLNYGVNADRHYRNAEISNIDEWLEWINENVTKIRLGNGKHTVNVSELPVYTSVLNENAYMFHVIVPTEYAQHAYRQIKHIAEEYARATFQEYAYIHSTPCATNLIAIR